MQIEAGPDRFALHLGPDGVYRVDGRIIPSTDHPAHGVDNDQFVVKIHRGVHQRESLGGIVGRVHIEQ